ncbi:MAG: radical SAM protein [archaeon]|nr:radical SAM protein [archaeon]
MSTVSVESNVTKPVINEYFSRKLANGKVLVATRHGSWSVLSGEQFDMLDKEELVSDKMLLRELEEKGIVLTEDGVRKIVHSYSSHYFHLADSRPLCIVYLTNKCNLACKYCHSDSRSDSSELSSGTMEYIVDFICNMPQKHIALEFQGGETLLRFDMLKKFLKLFDERVKAAGKIVESKVIVSNLTLMNEEIAEYILDNNLGLCTSLDGPKELHDKQRPFLDGRGSYDAVMKWIDYFSKRGRRLNFLPTITSISLNYEPKSLVDEYMKVGAKRIMFRPVYGVGRGAADYGLLMKPKDYFEFWKAALDYMVELSMDGRVFYDTTVQSMLVSIFTDRRSDMCMRRPCGAGITQFAFYLDGSIYACDLGKKNDVFKLGNVMSSSYEDVFLNTIQLRTNTPEFQPLCDTCVYSAFCNTCMCKSYARFGTVVPLTPLDFDCKVNKMMFDYIFEKMDDPVYRAVFEMWVRLKT